MRNSETRSEKDRWREKLNGVCRLNSRQLDVFQRKSSCGEEKWYFLFFFVKEGGSLNSCISTHLSSREGLGFPGKGAAVNMCADAPLRVQTASVVYRGT